MEHESSHGSGPLEVPDQILDENSQKQLLLLMQIPKMSFIHAANLLVKDQFSIYNILNAVPEQWHHWRVNRIQEQEQHADNNNKDHHAVTTSSSSSSSVSGGSSVPLFALSKAQAIQEQLQMDLHLSKM